jgi:hypothetical protein
METDIEHIKHYLEDYMRGDYAHSYNKIYQFEINKDLLEEIKGGDDAGSYTLLSYMYSRSYYNRKIIESRVTGAGWYLSGDTPTFHNEKFNITYIYYRTCRIPMTLYQTEWKYFVPKQVISVGDTLTSGGTKHRIERIFISKYHIRKKHVFLLTKSLVSDNEVMFSYNKIPKLNLKPLSEVDKRNLELQKKEIEEKIREAIVKSRVDRAMIPRSRFGFQTNLVSSRCEIGKIERTNGEKKK